MPDTTQLEALITRLTNDRALLQRGEAATRQGAVNPTLRALGWDTDNLDEVDPEFADSDGGKVDYCLRYRGKDLVLIEVKRASADLSQHQEQLLRYAFGLHVELAALTNGLDWWLYLPTKGGRSFERRRFARIDFREQDASEAATALDRFLNRDRVTTGATLKEAEHEFARQQLEQEVLAAMPEAWNRVLGDAQFHDLFAREVERIAGHRPDPDKVAAFIRRVASGDGGAVTQDREGSRTRQRRADQPAPVAAGHEVSTHPSQSAVPQPRGSQQKRPPRRIAAFWLDNRRHQAAQWQDMLVGVCNLLISETGPQFPQLVAGLQGRVRPRFAPSPDGYIRPRRLSNGMFTDTNLNANDSERRAREVLRAVRGSDDGFRIELAE